MNAFELKIKRTGYPSGGRKAYLQSFSIPLIEENMSVLDALIWAQHYADPSLAFRCACRVGMCGTCGTLINGREGLACRTLVRTVVDIADDADDKGFIRVEPMRNLPVLRDLVTDMAAFHSKIRQALSSDGAQNADRGLAAISPSSSERRQIDPQRECIYCGLCYSACTVVAMDSDFLGPAALNRAFVRLADSRSESAMEALEVVAHEEGLWRCHTLFECTAVCPKGISPTLAIQRLKRKVVGHKLRSLFRARKQTHITPF